jgi:hypothetical protein
LQPSSAATRPHLAHTAASWLPACPLLAAPPSPAQPHLPRGPAGAGDGDGLQHGNGLALRQCAALRSQPSRQGQVDAAGDVADATASSGQCRQVWTCRLPRPASRCCRRRRRPTAGTRGRCGGSGGLRGAGFGCEQGGDVSGCDECQVGFGVFICASRLGH